MKDPLRLVDAGGTEFERFLLTTAAEEAPSSEVSARMLAGVATAGAAVALLSGVQAAGEGAAASGAAQAGVGAAAMAGAGGSIAPPAAAGLAGAWLLKWGLIGALVSGGAVTGFQLLEAGERSTSRGMDTAPAALQEPASLRAPAGPSDVGPAGVPPAGALPAGSSPAPAPAPAPAAPADVAPPSRQRAAHSGAQALGPEIEVLDSARRALSAGDAERALTLIASYHRRFPSGALRQEATVLEVDALEAKGRAEQATDLKQQFLAEHPDSAHTQRVQRSGQAR